MSRVAKRAHTRWTGLVVILEDTKIFCILFFTALNGKSDCLLAISFHFGCVDDHLRY